MPTQNIGTLVGAAVRPINDTMPIASAFAFEINGGHHQVATLAARNAIIVQRRQWGMLCSVYNDPTIANNATYQLKYGHSDFDTSNNANWVLFSGGGGGGGSVAWVDPVISVSTNSPLSPADGDRYLVGKSAGDSLAGSFASLTNAGYSGTLPGGFIAQYSSSISGWVTTIPINGMTIRVNDEDNSFYRYEGTYSTGQWYKERVNQVRYLSAASSNKINYTITTGDYFTYSSEIVHRVQFGTANSGSTATLNINSLGAKNIKIQTNGGLADPGASSIVPSVVYDLIYDGTYFRLNLPGGGSSGGFPLKYRILPDEIISVPSYCEYLLYGDLEVNGIMNIDPTGKLVIINGALNLNGGTVSNYHRIEFVSFYGLPSGGSVGQVLYKSGSSDYSVGWTSSVSGGGGATPSLNQVLGVGNQTIDKNISLSQNTLITGSHSYIALWGTTYSNLFQASTPNTSFSQISNTAGIATHSVVTTSINKSSYYQKSISGKVSDAGSSEILKFDIGLSSGLGVGQYSTASVFFIRGTITAYSEISSPSYDSYAYGATLDGVFKVDKDGTISKVGIDIVEKHDSGFSNVQSDLNINIAGSDVQLWFTTQGGVNPMHFNFNYSIFKSSFGDSADYVI